MEQRRSVWKQWIGDRLSESYIPLFETDDDRFVQTTRFGRGKHERDVVKRNSEIGQRIIDQATLLEEDISTRSGQYEGLIYMMYWIENEEIKPLYIGKTSKFNSTGYELNPNIESLETRDNRFARWGYGKDWHLGDLSNALFNSTWLSEGNFAGTLSGKQRWVDRLFEPGTLKLRSQTYLWIDTWSVDEDGPFSSYTGTHPTLAELEYQLIGLADGLYGDILLNQEGTN